MPSGELVGTTLKFTGREVTDGHSHFPTGVAETLEGQIGTPQLNSGKGVAGVPRHHGYLH